MVGRKMYVVNTKPKVQSRSADGSFSRFVWYQFRFESHRGMIEFLTLNPEYEVDNVKGGIYGS